MKSFLILCLTILFSSIQLSNAIAQFDTDGQKYRIVAVKNGDESVQSFSNEINIFKQFKVDLPTAFTPNNDGLNDTFGGIVSSVYEYKLLIYDRNGEIIFKTNSVDERWDGTYNGMKVQSGSYVYQVVAVGPENAQVNKTGKVMVII